MATKNIVPNADSEGGIGTSSKYWATGFIDAITTTGNLVVGGNVTSNDLILTAGTLFGTGNTGFSNRSSDTTLYLQMPATGFNITDDSLNTRFILSSGGAATFGGSVTALNYRAELTSVGGYLQSWDGTNEVDYGSVKSISGSGNSYDGMIYTSHASSSFGIYTGGNYTTPKLTISSGGDVTITQPTNGSDAVLNLTAKSSSGNSRTSSLTYDADTENLIVNNAGTNALTISSDGAGTFSGAFNLPNITSGTGFDLVSNANGVFYVASSRKFKKNIEPIDIGLDFILSLEPVKYNLKSDDLAQVGFIAEDMPDERLQIIQPIDKDDSSQGVGAQGINYKQITAPLVKAIQEQQTIIEDLKSRIETLEG